MQETSDILDYKRTRATKGGASFRLRHRIQRMLWVFVWVLFASWTPPPFHRWRVLILKLFGANVHWSAHVYGSAKIWFPGNLLMGAHACLGPGVNCYNMALITIADFAIVSQGACLCAGTHDADSEDFQLIAKPIVIEESAWVAAEAFIGPGVTIATSSVVGARAVVFKNTIANTVYIGNPAKPLRERAKR